MAAKTTILPIIIQSITWIRTILRHNHKLIILVGLILSSICLLLQVFNVHAHIPDIGYHSNFILPFKERDIQSEKSRIAESSSVNYGLVNQRAGNGGYSLHESSSHGSKDNPKVSPSHSPLNNNPGKEFFTSKPSQKLSQPSR